MISLSLFIRGLTFFVLALCLACGFAWMVICSPIVFGLLLFLVLAFRWSIDDYNEEQKRKTKDRISESYDEQ